MLRFTARGILIALLKVPSTPFQIVNDDQIVYWYLNFLESPNDDQ